MRLHSQHIETARSIEMQLIAGVLLRPRDFHQASGVVTTDDFLSQAMADLWAAFEEMSKAGVEFWRESVMLSELIKSGVMAKIGGSPVLADLVTKTSPGHVLYHAEELAKWAERRRVVAALELALTEAQALSFDPDDVIGFAQQMLSRAKGNGSDGIEQIGEMMSAYLELLEGARSSDVQSAVVQTGFKQLDAALSGGIPLGSYAILAARPSIGKSALAMDIAHHAAGLGHPSLFVSLEMSDQQISQRQFVRDANMRITEMQTLSYTEEKVLEMLKACDDAKKIPLFIWQASGANVARIESRLRAEVAKRGIRLAIIDYLGLIRVTEGKSIYERVTMISNDLARISKQLNIALLVLCQLGRQAEGEVPGISNLRDSGAIEQDADIVMLLHREKRDSEKASLLIEKQRNGKIAQLTLNFDGKRFLDGFMQAKPFHKDFGG